MDITIGTTEAQIMQSCQYEVVKLNNGDVTLKVIFENRTVTVHSIYQPRIEAQKFVNSFYDETVETFIVYGFGFGYHIEELLAHLKPHQNIVCYELNYRVFAMAMEYRQLGKLFDHSNFELIINSAFDEFTTDLASRLLEQDSHMFVIHQPSLLSIPNAYRDFQELLEDWVMTKRVSQKHWDLIRDNIDYNKNEIRDNIGQLFGKYNGIDAFIVAAGPSLDKNIDDLKAVNKPSIIICVGRVLRKLLLEGIAPDFCVMIDPTDDVVQDLLGTEGFEGPLICLDTLNRNAVRMFRGLKFLASSKQSYLRPVDDPSWSLDTGGSVATTAIEIAIRLGCKTIVMVGQDLAYSENKTHFGNEGTRVSLLKNMRYVEGHNGERLGTTLGMLSYRRWIERKIQRCPNVQFINATDGGAIIRGATVQKLKDAVAILH